MRRSLFTVLLTLFVSISVFAQRPDREKIKALKIAHITEQLDLTETEAQKFWPVYNAHEEAKNKLRKTSSNRRKEKDADDLTEAEAKVLLLDMEKFEKQKVELESKLLNQLFKILPAKKIIKLYQAEHSFKQKMFDEYKKRHSNKKSDKK
ncbi:hypothetical protein [Winogradskyella endarachnes]|uniref:Sensor of ECF-type sigma factor n=1 Tax=Winogradskyella endarachnes TaxID=2681965 RepID=A0A6L6U7K2_9FLAO|nr:hypothetical protein [Winogradskyella endarachnes]MUU78233.1 hypothetical protein [Winogradskyella endarachnes]